nr:hypothetical protein [Tanacetum cinerariifolium]
DVEDINLGLTPWNTKPSELAQIATKGNLREVVTTCERSWVQASPWGFSFRSEKGVSLMDSIEKDNAERGLYKRVHDSRGMIHMAKEGMISKDALEIDNNVVGASYDKDNITEVNAERGLYKRVHDSRGMIHIAKEGMISKDASEIDNNVVGASYDKDNITENRVLVTKPQNKNPYELLHEKAGEENDQQYVLFPVWSSGSTNPLNTDGDVAFNEKKHESKVNVSPSSSAQSKKHDDKTKREAKGKSPVESLIGYRNLSAKFKNLSDNSINEDNAAGTLVPAVRQLSPNSTNTFSAAGSLNAAASPTHRKSSCIDTSQYTDDPNMTKLEDITYSDDEDDVGAEADFNNLEIFITVSPIPRTRVHKYHHVTQIIGDLSLVTQTRSKTRVAKDQCGLSQITNDDFHTCMFACFPSQEEPKRVHQALKDPSWIEAMQEELLQFKMKKEEGINYEEIFAPVARIEAIRLFLAYASFMGFMVYQMDVKSAFLYGTIKKEVYVYQPLGFEDPDYPDKVYKVAKALYGLH